jgi:hypothetical protein
MRSVWREQRNVRHQQPFLLYSTNSPFLREMEGAKKCLVPFYCLDEQSDARRSPTDCRAMERTPPGADT